MSLPESWGKPLGKKLKRQKAGVGAPKRRPAAKRPNYNAVLEQFTRALESMKANERRQIPEGTLPEMMTAWALIKNHFLFQSQTREGGGTLRLGGSTIDFLVQMGISMIVVRVMGDYWHSLPERKAKDALQLVLLRQQGYRVADLWEYDVYTAWLEGHLIQWVNEKIQEAQ